MDAEGRLAEMVVSPGQDGDGPHGRELLDEFERGEMEHVLGDAAYGRRFSRPRIYEYAELTVWFSVESLPTDQSERLLIRRSLGQDAELKYQRSNAPAEIPLKKLAQVGGSRWCIEKNFQSGKGECGLDEYETRGWTGWHHHTCLSMLALLFLTLQRQRLGEKTRTRQRLRNPQRPQTPAANQRLNAQRTRPLEPMANSKKRPRKTVPRTKTTQRIAKAHKKT